VSGDRSRASADHFRASKNALRASARQFSWPGGDFSTTAGQFAPCVCHDCLAARVFDVTGQHFRSAQRQFEAPRHHFQRPLADKPCRDPNHRMRAAISTCGVAICDAESSFQHANLDFSMRQLHFNTRHLHFSLRRFYFNLMRL